MEKRSESSIDQFRSYAQTAMENILGKSASPAKSNGWIMWTTSCEQMKKCLRRCTVDGQTSQNKKAGTTPGRKNPGMREG